MEVTLLERITYLCNAKSNAETVPELLHNVKETAVPKTRKDKLSGDPIWAESNMT